MPTHIESDIVVTGISGRLPESSNIEEFKENLMKGMDMVTEDERRWTPGMYGLPSRFGKLKDLGSFDASFFKIHPKQVHPMDPQLRIMLEVTYEALIDAGVNPSAMKGSRTGVFIGVSTSDANNFWKRNPNGYGLLGCSKAMFANRISYAFDLNGPSYSLDTACSSSLTAMHQAVVAIHAGECDAAIIGGLNLVLDPSNSLHFHRLNMLSKDGKCKAFDITADGYTRAEAVVAIYLQRAKDARRVYATVMNTAINTDGYKPEGITYPSGNIQYLMLQKVYSEVGINPEDVVYVEAHGSGTAVGDPEELTAIERLFCKNRRLPLQIGSVKSNMGHAEPASGLCSIAKVLIAMEAGVIPANLHFVIPNPKIPALSEGRIRVIDKTTPWNGGIVGINSFGAGGANAHVILRSNPKAKMSSVPDTVEPLLPKLVAVSGRTKEAVQVLLDKANEHRQDDEFLSLLHTVHSDNISGHNFRGYEILAYDGTREIVETNYDEKRSIWFVFSGMNTQWAGMGRELLGIETCQRSLQRCGDVLKSHDVDLMNIIVNGTEETYENVMIASVSIVAIQIALVDMLTSIDIRPDGIIGHSLGELSCSYADGAFTLDQTILAAYYKGKSILDSDLEPGAMAVINLNWEEARKMCPPDITPACHNSADSVTISGTSVSMKKFVEELKSKDILVKIINCSGIPFHSKYIVPAESKYRASLDAIPKPKQRSARWISSSVPEAAWDSPLAQFCSSEYHVNNMLAPVLFQEAITHIPENAITIEIAPHCLLQAALRISLPSTVTNVSLQKQNHSNNLLFLLSNVGKMYMAGVQPDISKLYPPISFPVGRGTPMIGSLIKWDHSAMWEVPDFKQKPKGSGEYVVEVNLSKETLSQGEELLGLVGFMTCIRREIANVRYVFIQDCNAPKFDLSSQFYAQQLEKGLMANVLKEGQWGSYRHLQLDQRSDVRVEHAYVNARTMGDLSSLEWIQSPLTYCQTELNRLCSVYYASLNFRDIMLAIGKLSTSALSSLGLTTEDYGLGLELSGRDANGCRVMGIAKSRGLMTTVLPDSDFLWKVPDKWTLEQAATIPIAYVISYYALFVRGRLKAGESVLIHSGASGIGQAAIAVALHAGCQVFTTVGTAKKQLFIKNTFPQLTDKHIGNSRDTSFERLIFDETQGRGANVILNSLAEEKLHAIA